jgi:predicted phage terminase large subunit-like protein
MSSLPSREAAARELLKRRRAREDLIAYANAIEIPGAPVVDENDAWVFQPIETTVVAHHRLIMRTLQETVEQPDGRLMLFFPPGAAKSTYASVVFPTWLMGKLPGYRVILGSYGDELARKHGRKARQIARSLAYRGIFGAEVSRDTSAADNWALTNGSEYMSGGIQGGITGNRANCVVIDDPIKGREEADSPVVREKTREEYNNSFLSRLLPGGHVILIQTRWHEDDLAGGILPEGYAGESGPILCRDGQVWNVLCVPAEAERDDDPLERKPGEFLWPEFYSARHWEIVKHDPSRARTWSALYQQRPAPAEGSYFLSHWLRPYPGPIPDKSRLRIYGASDYAVTAKGGDYTVHGVVGVDADNRIILLDVWRGQTDSAAWVEAMLDMVNTWRPIGWAEEGGQIKASVGPWIEQRSRERGHYVHRHQFPTRGDKAVRAQSIRGRMSLLGLFYPTGAPWFSTLSNELMSFPAGRHDDQVDMLGLIGQLLDQMERGGERVLQEKADNYWQPHDWKPPRERPGERQQYADSDWEPFKDTGWWPEGW